MDFESLPLGRLLTVYTSLIEASTSNMTKTEKNQCSTRGGSNPMQAEFKYHSMQAELMYWLLKRLQTQ